MLEDQVGMDLDDELDMYRQMEEEENKRKLQEKLGYSRMGNNSHSYEYDDGPCPDDEDIFLHEEGMKSNENAEDTNPNPIVIDSKYKHSALETIMKATTSLPQPKPFVKLTPVEMVLLMQKERMETFGISAAVADANKQRIAQAETEFHTTKCSFHVAHDSAKYTLPRPQLGRDSTTCILADGSRVHIQRRITSNVVDTNSSSTPTSSVALTRLLNKSMQELMREADSIQLTANCHKNEIKFEQQQEDIATSHYNQGLASGSDDANNHGIVVNENALWVDKYSPRSFSQLLSPEKINREVLRCVKRWDRFVFKTPPVVHLNPDGTEQQDYAMGDDGRPRNKVILLCGPPGTGKTTLAHIVAKHCGYRVLEINASDDRSPQFLRDSISRATQNSTLDVDKRPNCIILDEIDGIDGDSDKNALEILTNIIKAPLKSTKDKDKKNKKEATSVFALTRPLICICNDQYAPALRELRKLADIFVFSVPNEQRLIQRIKTICTTEGLHVSNSTFVNELCQATGNDIRSAVNNLQFATLKTIKSIRMQKMQDNNRGTNSSLDSKMDIGAVLETMVRNGLKDDQLDVYQVWKRIFTTQVGNTSNTQHNRSTANRNSSECIAAMDAMASYGDYQTVLAGMHENVYSVNGNCMDMMRHCQLSEWISFVDEIYAFTTAVPDGFQVLHYMPIVAAAVKNGAGNQKKVTIEWPKKDREKFYLKTQKLNIIQSMLDAATLAKAGAGCCGNSTVSKQLVSLDLISYLIDVISPRIRNAPLSTLGHVEQQMVLDVCAIMHSCGLTYAATSIIKSNVGTQQNKWGNNNKFGQKGGFNGSSPWKIDGNNKWVSKEETGFPAMPTLTLEPAIDTLIQYSLMDGELLGRHHLVNADLKTTIATEQKKYVNNLQINRYQEPESEKVHHAFSIKDETTTLSTTMTASGDATHGLSTEKKVSVGVNAGNREGPSASHIIMMEQQAAKAGGAKRQRGSNVSSFFAPISGAKPSNPFANRNSTKSTADVIDVSTLPAGTAVEDYLAAKKKAKVCFKFHQGFSDAVRRPVTIKEWV